MSVVVAEAVIDPVPERIPDKMLFPNEIPVVPVKVNVVEAEMETVLEAESVSEPPLLMDTVDEVTVMRAVPVPS